MTKSVYAKSLADKTANNKEKKMFQFVWIQRIRGVRASTLFAIDCCFVTH